MAYVETGDRASAKWAEKWWSSVRFSVGGARTPSNTINMAWAEAHLRIKWHLDPSTIHQRYRQTDRTDNVRIA